MNQVVKSNEYSAYQGYQTNQLRADLLSVCALQPWLGHVSMGRVQMFSSHLGQKLVIKGATERRCQTGMEAEFGKYNFATRLPEDGNIIRVIDRYKKTLDQDSINVNPQSIVIFEEDKTNRIGMIDMRTFSTYHQYFGYENVVTSHVNKLIPRGFVAKGTEFLRSPSITPDGGYKYGIELNMAFLGIPSIAEDGIMICEDVLDKLSFKIYETRVVEFGSKKFPINLYGDENNFKAFPDIGEYIKDTGVLMMLRSYEKNMSIVEQSIYDLMEPEYTFDSGIYVNGPGGKVVDIRIWHDEDSQSPTPIGMDKQAQKYNQATKKFYSEIVDEYKRLLRERGKALVLTPEFSRMVVESLAAIEDTEANKITKLYKRTQLDDYKIEFVIEYNVVPDIGYKLTGTGGDKGVICKIEKRENMPVDEAGNSADIVMAGESSLDRMNPSRNNEMFINASSRDTTKKLREMFDIIEHDKYIYSKVDVCHADNPTLFNKACNYLLGYYKIVSPKMFKFFGEDATPEVKIKHLTSVLEDGIYLFIPTDNEPETSQIIEEIQKHYPSTYGPITYVGLSGKKIKTKLPVRIASMYVMLLEKIGNDGAGVSSGKLQHYGILSQITKSDKYSQPIRVQPVRAMGETEFRIFVSYCGPLLVAELVDRNNSPTTHKHIVWELFKSKIPSNIYNLVDRNVIPYGGSKPLQLTRHVNLISGWKHVYKPSTKV